MPTHNYIAEPGQYPSHIKILGYGSQAEYNNRFKKSATERAELFALKLSREKAQKKEHGTNWKEVVSQLYKPLREFNNSIQSGAKIIAQWNN